MKGYYYLNFSDLSEEAQEQLIEDAKDDLVEEYSEDTLREEAENMSLDYDIYLREKAESHMYTFNFVFNI